MKLTVYVVRPKSKVDPRILAQLLTSLTLYKMRGWN